MKIAIGSDRCGFQYKSKLISYMNSKGYEVTDVGIQEEVPSDSPFFASKVGKLVASGCCNYGVLICATGTGMVIAANKIIGIMCGMGYGDEVTKLMREHNDCNVIAFGQEHMEYKDIERRFEIFIHTEFADMKHHEYRVNQIKSLERGEKIELQSLIEKEWKKTTPQINHIKGEMN